MSEAVALRRAQETDAAAIRDLTRAAYAKWVPVIGREPKPMGADYEVAVRNHRFDLLYVGNALAGLIETVDEGDQLLVENVAVSPAHQGRGFGTRLMALAEEVALSLGRNRIRLYTNNLWAENLRLYSSLGYRVDSQDEIDGGMYRISMSKSLGDAGQDAAFTAPGGMATP